MTTYKFTDPTNTVVHVIDADGVSRSSMLAAALPDGVNVLPADPVTPQIPQIVTMRQARLALLAAGKLAQVDAVIESLPEPHKSASRIEWDYSSEVQRDRPFVQQIGAALGYTSEQLDQLFIEASKL